MKRLSSYIVLVFAGLIFIGTTDASAQTKMKKKEVLLVPDDLKWKEIKGGRRSNVSRSLG